jgi:hypothetical protein
LYSYVNVPSKIASVVNSRLATLNELQTIYSYEDLYIFHELIIIRLGNEDKMRKKAERQGRNGR